VPEFEFDERKSAANWLKHGVSLAEAATWWHHADRKFLPSRLTTESRHALFTHHQGKLWTVFFTIRAGKIRLISARPASREERASHFRR
jgi:uncharacterized DUF497 family protein